VFKVSKQVEQFFHLPIPREVWHYTSLAGFEGIISSGKMWATEARFTTDKTEYIFAQEVAVGYLKSMHPSDEYSQLAIRDLLEIIDRYYKVGVLSPKFADVFVASFSAAEDLKSQWIDFGDAYRGVSIAFDLREIRPPVDTDTSISFAPCIYKFAEQRRLIQAAISRIMVHVDALRNDEEYNVAVHRTWPIVQSIFGDKAGSTPYRTRTNAEILTLLKKGESDMRRDFFVLTSHYKNAKFEEENEWRLVLPRSRKKNSGQYRIKYRDKELGGEIVKAPYIEVDLSSTPGKLPITRVMAGPKCDSARVKSVLDACGYSVPLAPSQVPIR
jgi:hypothetical protein